MVRMTTVGVAEASAASASGDEIDSLRWHDAIALARADVEGLTVDLDVDLVPRIVPRRVASALIAEVTDSIALRVDRRTPPAAHPRCPW